MLLSFITLLIILAIVTLIPNVAPGDPARQIAGPTASVERLEAVRTSLGLDKSIPEQLADSFTSLFTLDFGATFNNPSVTAGELISGALWNSAKLVVFSLAITLPISILGGVIAAYKKDSLLDRLIVNVGAAFSAIPDFVSGVILLAVLAVPFSFFRVGANAPAGSGIFTQMRFLLLPALAVLLVYFGYIARVTRASTISALESDFARTAFMKGLSTRQVFTQHVLRNSLVPTVAVVGTQIGFLFGGLIGLELIFNYPGLGRLILTSVTDADYPVLRAGVITVALIYMVATLVTDLLIAWMNPRARLALTE